jgi:hypothetical protein
MPTFITDLVIYVKLVLFWPFGRERIARVDVGLKIIVPEIAALDEKFLLGIVGI